MALTNRYESLTTRTVNNKRVYNSAMPISLKSNIPLAIITPGPGIRFDNLAYRYYGDTSLWWVIALYNNQANGSLHPNLYKQLYIPSI